MVKVEKFTDDGMKSRVFKLNPKKKLTEKNAKTLQRIMRTDSRFRYAVPLELIAMLDFVPPKPRLSEKIPITKHMLSKALQAKQIEHSYMSMEKKLHKLHLRKLKSFCEKAGIEKENYDHITEHETIARLLWRVVEAAEEEEPKNLSSKEISAILKEKNVKAWSKSLKERFATLSMKSLIEVADRKGIDIPLSLLDKEEAKQELLERIWEEKESYSQRRRVYNMRRRLQDMKPILTKKGIKNYFNIRKDTSNATIRKLHFTLKPYKFFVENVWCCGYAQDHLLFCIAPTLSEINMKKKGFFKKASLTASAESKN